MVDVIQHKIFPTVVSEFKHDMSSEEHGIVLKELRLSKTNNILQTKDDLHTKLPLFKTKVFQTTEKICRESKYLYDTLEITGMWANMLKKGFLTVTSFKLSLMSVLDGLLNISPS